MVPQMGKCGDFTSGKAKGDWGKVESYFRSIDEKIAGENENVYVKSTGQFNKEFSKEKRTVQRT